MFKSYLWTGDMQTTGSHWPCVPATKMMIYAAVHVCSVYFFLVNLT